MNRPGLLITAGLILSVGGYVYYIFHSTGFFRALEPVTLPVYEAFPVPGVEDFAISREAGFLMLSSDDRAAIREGKRVEGGIYLLDLHDPKASPGLISQNFEGWLNPHGIFMLRLDSMDFRLWVINHANGDHTIEVFSFDGSRLEHEMTHAHPSMISPNDVVAIDETRYYFTNDHHFTSGIGLLAENYLGLAISNVIYFDGSSYREVANDIAYANGINFDVKRNLLFVASPRDFQVNVYATRSHGDLQFIEAIPAGTGVDNIEFDENGRLLIGCHPNLLAFTSYAAGRSPISPSEVIRIDYRSQGDYAIETLWLDDGSTMSAATVAIDFQNKLYVGNVMDPNFVVLQMTN